MAETSREGTFYFIGVSTQNSAIMQVFPRWMETLGLPGVRIQGIDHPLNDSRENYRATVKGIKEAPPALGALVTSHKIDLSSATGDLFDSLDPLAQITGEISCISKRGGELHGHALDPISAGNSLDDILGQSFFKGNQAQVLCFGAGGAGKAIGLHFARMVDSGDRPHRIVVVDVLPERLDEFASMMAAHSKEMEIETKLGEMAGQNDALVSALPPGSLVINATGLGKDRPGSPVSDAAAFPENGIAWDTNYRGELDFLRQAERQRESRGLKVEDGWGYFLHGWSEHIKQVLDIEIPPEMMARLAADAAGLRPS
ncbi:MAG: shikimate dehydrogenase [Anaerolineae bacterium]|nr:shikimate dehydrogenase [Anaerolineae bacterium]